MSAALALAIQLVAAALELVLRRAALLTVVLVAAASGTVRALANH
jgi:hypothetical protein